jgi:hypothetical protein
MYAMPPSSPSPFVYIPPEAAYPPFWPAAGHQQQIMIPMSIPLSPPPPATAYCIDGGAQQQHQAQQLQPAQQQFFGAQMRGAASPVFAPAAMPMASPAQQHQLAAALASDVSGSVATDTTTTANTTDHRFSPDNPFRQGARGGSLHRLASRVQTSATRMPPKRELPTLIFPICLNELL